MTSLTDQLTDIAVFPVRVIIVEDEEAVAEALRDLLESKGYLVETLRCPMTALKRLATERFDVILLDYRMPSMNGRQFFEKARRRGITLPTVLISGFVDETRLMEMVNLGLCRFLQKPANGEALFDCLQSLGFGPDEVLSRQAEWSEWRAQWADITDTKGQRTDLRFPDAGADRLLFPIQVDSQREMLLDAAMRWHETGVQALSGETGLDFEPFFDALLTEATYGGIRAEHIDGTTNAFQEALQGNLSAGAIPVGWFNDAGALRHALEKWVALGARARVGWVFEEKSPERATIHPFWRPYRLAPLRERPEAVAHYARTLLARQTKQTYGQAWTWQPDCGPLLLGQFWPGNFRDLSACIDRVILHSAEEDIRATSLRAAIGLTAASSNISPAEDALAHNLWPVLRQTSDDQLVATLSGIPLERIAAARAALPAGTTPA
ncbi:MAG: response regulator [Opitutales bacterium]|nr:response regulator [Opitutales bacterium]